MSDFFFKKKNWKGEEIIIKEKKKTLQLRVGHQALPKNNDMEKQKNKLAHN